MAPDDYLWLHKDDAFPDDENLEIIGDGLGGDSPTIRYGADPEKCCCEPDCGPCPCYPFDDSAVTADYVGTPQVFNPDAPNLDLKAVAVGEDIQTQGDPPVDLVNGVSYDCFGFFPGQAARFTGRGYLRCPEHEVEDENGEIQPGNCRPAGDNMGFRTNHPTEDHHHCYSYRYSGPRKTAPEKYELKHEEEEPTQDTCIRFRVWFWAKKNWDVPHSSLGQFPIDNLGNYVTHNGPNLTPSSPKDVWMEGVVMNGWTEQPGELQQVPSTPDTDDDDSSTPNFGGGIEWGWIYFCNGAEQNSDDGTTSSSDTSSESGSDRTPGRADSYFVTGGGCSTSYNPLPKWPVCTWTFHHADFEMEFDPPLGQPERVGDGEGAAPDPRVAKIKARVMFGDCESNELVEVANFTKQVGPSNDWTYLPHSGMLKVGYNKKLAESIEDTVETEIPEEHGLLVYGGIIHTKGVTVTDNNQEVWEEGNPDCGSNTTPYKYGGWLVENLGFCKLSQKQMGEADVGEGGPPTKKQATEAEYLWNKGKGRSCSNEEGDCGEEAPPPPTDSYAINTHNLDGYYPIQMSNQDAIDISNQFNSGGTSSSYNFTGTEGVSLGRNAIEMFMPDLPPEWSDNFFWLGNYVHPSPGELASGLDNEVVIRIRWMAKTTGGHDVSFDTHVEYNGEFGGYNYDSSDNYTVMPPPTSGPAEDVIDSESPIPLDPMLWNTYLATARNLDNTNMFVGTPTPAHEWVKGEKIYSQHFFFDHPYASYTIDVSDRLSQGKAALIRIGGFCYSSLSEIDQSDTRLFINVAHRNGSKTIEVQPDVYGADYDANAHLSNEGHMASAVIFPDIQEDGFYVDIQSKKEHENNLPYLTYDLTKAFGDSFKVPAEYQTPFDKLALTQETPRPPNVMTIPPFYPIRYDTRYRKTYDANEVNFFRRIAYGPDYGTTKAQAWAHNGDSEDPAIVPVIAHWVSHAGGLAAYYSPSYELEARFTSAIDEINALIEGSGLKFEYSRASSIDDRIRSNGHAGFREGINLWFTTTAKMNFINSNADIELFNSVRNFNSYKWYWAYGTSPFASSADEIIRADIYIDTHGSRTNSFHRWAIRRAFCNAIGLKHWTTSSGDREALGFTAESIFEDFTGSTEDIVGVSGAPPNAELSSSLDYVSGENNAWSTRTVDISAYAGQKVKLVFNYHANDDGFKGDIQLDNIQIDGLTYSFESSTESFQTTVIDTPVSDYENVTWYNLGNATGGNSDRGRWVRNTGDTPSSGTGRSDADDGEYYVYAEVTTVYQDGHSFLLRSPAITLGSNPTLSYAEARYGEHMGTLNVHVEVIETDGPNGDWVENQSPTTFNDLDLTVISMLYRSYTEHGVNIVAGATFAEAHSILTTGTEAMGIEDVPPGWSYPNDIYGFYLTKLDGNTEFQLLWRRNLSVAEWQFGYHESTIDFIPGTGGGRTKDGVNRNLAFVGGNRHVGHEFTRFDSNEPNPGYGMFTTVYGIEKHAENNTVAQQPAVDHFYIIENLTYNPSIEGNFSSLDWKETLWAQTGWGCNDGTCFGQDEMYMSPLIQQGGKIFVHGNPCPFPTSEGITNGYGQRILWVDGDPAFKVNPALDTYPVNPDLDYTAAYPEYAHAGTKFSNHFRSHMFLENMTGRVVLQQARYGAGGVRLPFDANWRPYLVAYGMTAEEFLASDGSSPDFSPSGGEMKFGFRRTVCGISPKSDLQDVWNQYGYSWHTEMHHVPNMSLGLVMGVFTFFRLDVKINA